ncbi:hypothetical protein Ancab_012184 [Ancistrocladus abbreviatus]
MVISLNLEEVRKWKQPENNSAFWTRSDHHFSKTPASKTAPYHQTPSRKPSSKPLPPSAPAPPLFYSSKKDKMKNAAASMTLGRRPGPLRPVVGLTPEANPPESCIAEKGGALIGEGAVAGDSVEEEDENKKDEVVVVGGEEEKRKTVSLGSVWTDCEGWTLEEWGGEIKKEENDDEKPTLVEGNFRDP